MLECSENSLFLFVRFSVLSSFSLCIYFYSFLGVGSVIEMYVLVM